MSGCGSPQPGSLPPGQSVVPGPLGHESVQAIPVILPPLIDGKLDEGIWQQPPSYSNFVVVGGANRAPRRRTTFRIAYDAANLYMALTCPTDTSIGPPRVRHWQDDDEAIDEDESCRVLLWPEPDQGSVYFEFTINPQGVVCDAKRYRDYPLSSAGWDGPTRAAAVIGQGVWQAELMVPLRHVGIPDKPWYINVIRHDALAEERSSLWPVGATSRPAPEETARRPPGASLIWPAPARPFVTGPLPIRQLVLDDMEDAPKGWEAWGAAVLGSSEHVARGRRSLEVRFVEAGGRISRSLQQPNLSGWQTIRFSLFVEGPEEVAFGVRLRDAAGRIGTAWFLASAGANDVSLPLQSLGAGLQLRSIKVLEFLSGQPVRVWLDGVRLQEDAISFHEQPGHPVRQSRSSLEVRIDPTVLARPMSTPSVAVDVIVPLFGTQKVRRLERRCPVMTERLNVAAEEFSGHDARDPIRIVAFFRMNGQDYLAFRERHLSQPLEVVTFGPGDFPSPSETARPSTRPGI